MTDPAAEAARAAAAILAPDLGPRLRRRHHAGDWKGCRYE
jgi:hypothetical protein